MSVSSQNTAQPKAEIPILNATWRDLGALSRLEKQCFMREDAWPLIELMGVLTLPDTVRLKMEKDGGMIAFLGGDIRRREGVGWIITIAVAPTWRGKGLGTRLLAAGEKALGLPRVRLTVRASNQPAIQMYLKAGYRQVKISPKYYAGGEDGLVFEKVMT
ncbi:MAG: GNAT family N-acetyltransferase [Anaerolineaceae bacterium]